MNQEEFDTEYYFAIIEKFYNLAIDFEMVGDKFFQLQLAAANIPDDKVVEIENHPMFSRCEKKLETIAHILKKIK